VLSFSIPNSHQHLAKKYANPNLSRDDIKMAIMSISDNHSFLMDNRDPCDRMLDYLNTYFNPNSYDPGTFSSWPALLFSSPISPPLLSPFLPSHFLACHLLLSYYPSQSIHVTFELLLHLLTPSINLCCLYNRVLSRHRRWSPWSTLDPHSP